MPRHSKMQHNPHKFYEYDFINGVNIVHDAITIDDSSHHSPVTTIFTGKQLPDNQHQTSDIPLSVSQDDQHIRSAKNCTEQILSKLDRRYQLLLYPLLIETLFYCIYRNTEGF